MKNLEDKSGNVKLSNIFEFNEYLKKNIIKNQNIIILQLNACSISNLDRFEKLKQLIDFIKINVDVIIISETWLNDELCIFYNLNGFQSFFSNRYDRRGGGIAVYVRNGIKCNLLSKCSDIFYGLWLEIIDFSFEFKKFYIGAYYRPPNSNKNKFLDNLEINLSKYSNFKCCLAGDFNIDILNDGSNEYKQILDSYNFKIVNNNITRNCSGSIIDHFSINYYYKFKTENITIDNDISDHNLIIHNIYINRCKHNINIIDKCTINYNEVNLSITKKLDNIFTSTLPDDVNILYNYYEKTIKDSLITHTNIKQIKIREKELNCKWMTKEIIILIKYKHNLIKRYKYSNSNLNLQTKISVISKKIIKLKKVAKMQYYLQLFEKSKYNKKETWQNIKKILSMKNKNKSIVSIYDKNKTVNTDNKFIVNTLNNYFATIPIQMSSLISNSTYSENLNRNLNSIYLKPTNESEILDVIKYLNINKSSGHDNISNKLLKICCKGIGKFLSRIVNLIFETGIYPKNLKLAKVIAVYKSGDSNDVNNYRPISILNSTNKIIEKLIYSRLINFLNKNNYFYQHQYGFRQFSNTTVATTEIMNKILFNIDSGKIVTGLFLDLSKAFDTVDHEILFDKLDAAGIRGIPLSVIKNYLTNRKQYVIVNGVSTETFISLGVPQGSVLGPLLYLVYINNIKNLNLKGQLNLYADDCALFYSDRNIDANLNNINYDLDLLYKYFCISKLTLNINKSQFINFHPKNKIIPKIIVTYNNIQLKNVSEIKYLGLILDSNLTWKQHTLKIANKISPIIGILWKFSKLLPKQVLFNIFFCLIYSNLQYLTIIWGSAASCFIKPLQVLENRAIKNILNLPKLYHTYDLYTNNNLRILPIRGIYQYQLSVHIYQCLHNLIHHTIIFNLINRTYHIRNQNVLVSCSIKSNFGRSRLEFIGVNLFNIIPIMIRNSPFPKFKKLVKSWLLESNQLKTHLNN